MADKKVSYITLKEKQADGTIDPKAVERNMLMKAKRDGDEVMRNIMDGSTPLGEDPWSKALGFKEEQFDELFKDASEWFDRNGIVDPNIKEPKIPETSYYCSKPSYSAIVIIKKESLLKRAISWMKRKITNT